MKKTPLHITVLFSLIVFAVLTITVILTGALMMLLYHTGILTYPHRGIIIFAALAVSIVFGIILSVLFGKRPIETIIEISEAAKEMAKGNFDIRLSEDIKAAEIREMAHSFNIMTKELAGTEYLEMILLKMFLTNLKHPFRRLTAMLRFCRKGDFQRKNV